MRKRLFLIFLFLGLVSIPGVSSAQQGDGPWEYKLENVPGGTNPFSESKDVGDGNFQDYYKFGSVSIEVLPDKMKHDSGESVVFKGDVINTNDYPIFDGEIYVQIFSEQDESSDSFKNGDDLRDQFFLSQKIDIDAKEKKSIDISWPIPSNAEKGRYKAVFHFIVSRHYNMSGLSFLNNVYAGMAYFNVESKDISGISIDRNNIKLNGEVLSQRAFNPQIASGEKVHYEVPIINDSPEKKPLKIKESVFYWDGIFDGNKLGEKESQVSVEPGNQYVYVYDQESFEEPVYFIVIEVSDGDNKSLINLRFSADTGTRARVNYSGLTKFPLKKGDQAVFFTSFHSVSEKIFNGSVEAVLKDRDGDVLDTLDYSGEIPGNINLRKKDFKAKSNLSYAVLTSTVKDASGRVVDQADIVLDASKLSGYLESDFPANPLPDSLLGQDSLFKTVVFIIIVLLVISLILIIFKRAKNRKYIQPLGFLLVISVGLLYYFLSQDRGKSFEIARAGDGIWTESGGTASITIGGDIMLNSLGCTNPADPADLWKSCFVYGGKMTSINYYPELKSGATVFDSNAVNAVSIGGMFDFDFNRDAEWFSYGYNVDSPPVHWRDEGNNSADRNYFDFNGSATSKNSEFTKKIGCNDSDRTSVLGQRYAPAVAKNPEIELVGDGAVIQCETRPSLCHENFTGEERTKNCDVPVGSGWHERIDERSNGEKWCVNTYYTYRGIKNCSEGSDEYSCDGGSICRVVGNGQGSITVKVGESKFVPTNGNSCSSTSCSNGTCLGWNCSFYMPSYSFLMDGKAYDGYIPIPSYTRTYNFIVANPPVATINSPADGYTAGSSQSISFSGTGTDSDGTITEHAWYDGGCGINQIDSSLYSKVGLGTANSTSSFSKTFSAGTHTIYYRVKDNDGAWSSCDSRNTITLSITPQCGSIIGDVEWCTGDTSGLSASDDGEKNLVDGPASCTLEKKCEYYEKSDGKCGDASEDAYCTTPPSSKLCNKGTPSSVSVEGDKWKWSCDGVNGDDIDCYSLKSCAYKEVNPN